MFGSFVFPTFFQPSEGKQTAKTIYINNVSNHRLKTKWEDQLEDHFFFYGGRLTILMKTNNDAWTISFFIFFFLPRNCCFYGSGDTGLSRRRGTRSLRMRFRWCLFPLKMLLPSKYQSFRLLFVDNYRWVSFHRDRPFPSIRSIFGSRTYLSTFVCLVRTRSKYYLIKRQRL